MGWKMKKSLLIAAALMALSGSAMAFDKWEEQMPPPYDGCFINNPNPPTIIRAQPNRAIIDRLSNGTFVKFSEQKRVKGQLWDYIAIQKDPPTGHYNKDEGWVLDNLLKCPNGETE
jgi:hypothetical protein